MSPTPGARRPCPRAYAPWLLSLAATLLLAVGAALAQWDLESILSRAEQRYGELGAATPEDVQSAHSIELALCRKGTFQSHLTIDRGV